jgi:serine/threonine-protein kinase HipA
MVNILHQNSVIGSFEQDKNNYLLRYESDILQNSISLSLPNTKKIYFWEGKFPPFFETFLPEGYLYEVFKNLLTKEYGYIDDYLIFKLLANNIESRVSFKTDNKTLILPSMDLEEILQNDTKDTFSNLLHTFLNKNSISGVQPKTIAVVKDKDSFDFKEVIVKTWGDEYPNLAENEYFCLKATQKAGVKIPKIHLSKNKRFLVVEKFIYKEDKSILGFEEVLSLMDKNRINKYSGSYEQIVKTIYPFLTNKKRSMVDFYKIVVMNYLLKNGDAHLKNFGLLFSDDFKEINLSPAYDIVTTTAYIFKDKPALTLEGKKIWHSKDALVRFGVKSCNLTKTESLSFYGDCVNALKISIKELELYIKENSDFALIGKRMLDSWKLSLITPLTKYINF